MSSPQILRTAPCGYPILSTARCLLGALLLLLTATAVQAAGPPAHAVSGEDAALLLFGMQAGTQPCAPEEMTDMAADVFDLTWTPDAPYGDTMYYMQHANNGPNVNSAAHPVIANLYELNDQFERSRLVVSRATNDPVQPGPTTWFGQGGYDNTIVQGKTYEFELVYECDTNQDNDSLFRIAHTANPDYVVFRDGMEGAPLPSAETGNGEQSSK